MTALTVFNGVCRDLFQILVSIKEERGRWGIYMKLDRMGWEMEWITKNKHPLQAETPSFHSQPLSSRIASIPEILRS